MGFTFLIYSIILIGFILFPLYFYVFDYQFGKLKYWSFGTIPPILLYGLIEGNRYKVGFDWEQYRDIYLYLERGHNYREGLDIFYHYLNLFFVNLGFNYSSIFIFKSSVLIFSICYFFRDYPRALVFVLPFFLYFFRDHAENLSRQFLSISILLIGLDNLLKNKILFFIIFGIIASLIHFASIVFIPLFIIIYYWRYIPNRLFLIVVYLLTTTFGFKIFSSSFVLFENLLDFSNRSLYSAALDTDSKYYFEWEMSILAKLIMHLTALFIIVYGYEIVAHSKLKNDLKFQFIYKASIIGMIFHAIFYKFELFARFNYYFYIFLPFCLSLVIYFLFFKEKRFLFKLLRYPVSVLMLYYTYVYYGHLIVTKVNFQFIP